MLFVQAIDQQTTMKVLIMLVLLGSIHAQSNIGQRFVTTLPANYKSFAEYVFLVTSNYSGTVVARRYRDNITQDVGTYKLTNGVVKVVIYDSGRVLNATVTDAVEITTDIEVAVYFVSYRKGSIASYTVFPTSTLATHYILGSYKPVRTWYNFLHVTSLSSSNYITVSNNGTDILQRNLTQLQSCMLALEIDITGFSVVSSNPVSVVSGSTCSQVPEGVSFCDTLADSPIPLKYWGNRFIIPPMPPRTAYIVRFIAESSNSSVELKYRTNQDDEMKTVWFNGMHEMQFGMTVTVCITNKPVYVVQYALGTSSDNEKGDPTMSPVPAIQHFSNNYVFKTPLEDKEIVNRIVIIIENKYAADLTLDKANVTGNYTHVPPPYDNYRVMFLEISNSTHVLQHPSANVKFSVLFYGTEIVSIFSFNLGFSFDIGKCVSTSCQNEGRCTDGVNGHMYTCTCISGYTGINCETDIDECIAQPCKHGASCVNEVGGFVCSCSSGFYGILCEDEINECESLPCKNNGNCRDAPNSYRCLCEDGYTGPNCDEDINECESSPCRHNGTCTDTVNGYNCSCEDIYRGPNCEEDTMQRGQPSAARNGLPTFIVVISSVAGGIVVLSLITLPPALVRKGKCPFVQMQDKQKDMAGSTNFSQDNPVFYENQLHCGGHTAVYD